MRNTRWKGFIHFPEAILIDILVRLPVKSLIRFICVCKPWSALIGSSSFIRTHLNRNVTKPAHVFLIALQYSTRGDNKLCHSLFCNETFKKCLEIGHPLGIRRPFVIYGSTNGLVCLSDQTMRLKSPIFVCNPSIRKYVILPMSSISLQLFSGYDNVLAFGFNRRLSDYKVVRMVSYKQKYHIDVELYSSNTNSWKRIDVIPPLIRVLHWYSGYAIFNGVAYWIMIKGFSTLHLVSFDTGSEVFEEFLLPDTLAIKRHPSIHMYKGSVCLLQCGISGQGESIDIWVLQGKSLIYLGTVTVPEMNISPLGFSINNELIVEYHETDIEGSDLPGSYLSLFRLEIKEHNNTGISLARISYCRHCDYYADTYIESLALLRAGKATP